MALKCPRFQHCCLYLRRITQSWFAVNLTQCGAELYLALANEDYSNYGRETWRVNVYNKTLILIDLYSLWNYYVNQSYSMTLNYFWKAHLLLYINIYIYSCCKHMSFIGYLFLIFKRHNFSNRLFVAMLVTKSQLKEGPSCHRVKRARSFSRLFGSEFIPYFHITHYILI